MMVQDPVICLYVFEECHKCVPRLVQRLASSFLKQTLISPKPFNISPATQSQDNDTMTLLSSLLGWFRGHINHQPNHFHHDNISKHLLDPLLPFTTKDITPTSPPSDVVNDNDEPIDPVTLILITLP